MCISPLLPRYRWATPSNFPQAAFGELSASFRLRLTRLCAPPRRYRWGYRYRVPFYIYVYVFLYYPPPPLKIGGSTTTLSNLPPAAVGELLASFRAFDAEAMYVFLYIICM